MPYLPVSKLKMGLKVFLKRLRVFEIVITFLPTYTLKLHIRQETARKG